MTGTPAGAVYSWPRKSLRTSTAFAALRVMMSPASSGLNRVFTGTNTPPAVSSPNAATIQSAEFGAQMATRSPFGNTQIVERACGTTYPLDELSESQAQRTVDDRFCVAEPVRRAQDHLRDGLPVGPVRHTVTRRDRFPPMIFAWSSTDRCDSALT